MVILLAEASGFSRFQLKHASLGPTLKRFQSYSGRARLRLQMQTEADHKRPNALTRAAMYSDPDLKAVPDVFPARTPRECFIVINQREQIFNEIFNQP